MTQTNAASRTTTTAPVAAAARPPFSLVLTRFAAPTTPGGKKIAQAIGTVSPLKSGKGFKIILDELPTGDIAAFLRTDTGTDVLDALGFSDMSIKTQESFIGRDNTPKIAYGTLGRATRHARKADGSGGRGFSLYFDALPNPKRHLDEKGRVCVYLYPQDNAVKAPVSAAPVDAETAALGTGINPADLEGAWGDLDTAALDSSEVNAPAEVAVAEVAAPAPARAARPRASSRKPKN